MALTATAASAGSPAQECNPVPLVGCSNANIQYVGGSPCCDPYVYGNGSASGYYPAYSGPLWISWILYAPGFVVIPGGDGQTECASARSCSFPNVFGDAAEAGTYALCVHTWEPGSSDQPQACASINVK